MNPARMVWVGFALIIAGFFVVAAGSLSGASSVSTGGFIMIGPIPIVFGSGPDSTWLGYLGLIVLIAMVAVYVASFFLWRSRARQLGETKPESD